MNDRQRRILALWRQHLSFFVQREWLTILLWSLVGALGACGAKLVFQDRSFRAFVVGAYLPPRSRFDDPYAYQPFALLSIAILILIVLVRFPELVKRGFRSWFDGVTSGLGLFCFSSAFLVLTITRGSTVERFGIYGGTVLALFLASFTLFLRGRIQNERDIAERDIAVPKSARSDSRSDLPRSDDPIQTWSQDYLNRVSLVDNISAKLIVSKSPVVALFGEFGSGKTSVLNLIRERLRQKAILVSFSTWLPGSQETLISYLLADIASECRKQYVVPGLNKSARRLAIALANSVPLLKNYVNLRQSTQRDDIEQIGAALSRLPLRVIVLLDEIDRMEKEEIISLLKLIRGVSTLPNLSFVCALDLQQVMKTVKNSTEDETQKYFEKFFPVSFQLPMPEGTVLQNAGVDRLSDELSNREWFTSDQESETFKNDLRAIWPSLIAPICTNLRAIGLVANDVGVAAALLKREVDPIDLTLIEMLRRFFPSVYEVVSKNSLPLTGGESWLKGGRYLSDQEKERLSKRFLESLKEAAGDDERFERVAAIVSKLFPRFDKLRGVSWTPRFETTEGVTKDKRISRPSMFAAYFRYELPEGVFSSVELERFLEEFARALDSQARQAIFTEAISSLEKGSLKRDDFLRKLSDHATLLPLSSGKQLAMSAMKDAKLFLYDSFFTGYGEAGHALRLVLRVALKLDASERVEFLSACMLEASDDTMTFRILTMLTGKREDFDLNVSFSQLYPVFIRRMRSRYGKQVRISDVDITTSDTQAFNLWGMQNPTGLDKPVDPEDRIIQRDFWLRYIGQSRSKLADIFHNVFMPVGLYNSDPTPFVENKLPITDLRMLFETLPPDPALTEVQSGALLRLERFLRGDFENGIDIGPTGGH